MDGVPGLSFHGIEPGGLYVYSFKFKQNGTYWYNRHSGLQEQVGRPLVHRCKGSRIGLTPPFNDHRLLQTSNMLSIASGRAAAHFTHRGLIKALDIEMDAGGNIFACWCDESYIDNAVVDFSECLLEASGQDSLRDSRE